MSLSSTLPLEWRLPLKMLFLLLLSLSLFGVTRVRFAVLDKKVVNADPQSSDGATGCSKLFGAM